MSSTDPSKQWRQEIDALDAYAPTGEHPYIASSCNTTDGLASSSFIPGKNPTMTEKVVQFCRKTLGDIARMIR
jgi:hypothetical protein